VPVFSKELGSVLGAVRTAFVISDPSTPDCPIEFASDGFYELTGYGPEDVIGKNWYVVSYLPFLFRLHVA
jgi:hypothetical protein